MEQQYRLKLYEHQQSSGKWLDRGTGNTVLIEVSLIKSIKLSQKYMFKPNCNVAM